MRKLIAPALLLLMIVCAPLQAQTQGTTADNQLAGKIDVIARQVLQSTGVPSASLAVVTNGRVTYAQAYGAARLEPISVAARPDMRYAIGSVSKQFTAAAVLLLQQDGKLSLDDPVSRFLPDLTRANEVTIRELLSHTSGYQDFWRCTNVLAKLFLLAHTSGYQDFWPQDYAPPMMLKSISPQGILDRWAKLPLDFEPGTRWQYSNTNYTIAALIVEKASGEPFFRFVRNRILDPLKLASAVDFDAKPITAPDPAGYLRYGLGPLRAAPDAGAGWMYGAGELAMTASDLARWDISLINQSLLRPSSYRMMETEVLLKNGAGTNYGLGVDVAIQGGHRAISHTGEVSGFTASNIVFPDDRAAVVVLTNQDAAPAAGAIAQQIGRLLFTTEDVRMQSRTTQARNIFVGLQQGTIDRSLFTADTNAYFSDAALKDFALSLGTLGAPQQFVQTGQQERGGMVLRVYPVTFPKQTLRVWTYEMPDGKLEQYQIAPQG